MTYSTEVRLKQQGSVGIVPTQVILHSLANAYNFEGGVGWLEDPGNPLEAHYAIAKDGHRVQIVSETQRAEANYNANRRPDGTGAISIETDSSINADEPWSDDQVASIVELVAAICRRHGIPARLCRSSDDPGIGWHIMWGSPGAWTPVSKACPGPARIEQVKNVIVPRVAAALSGKPPATTDEDDEMTPELKAQLDRIEAKLKNVDADTNRWDTVQSQATTNPDKSKTDDDNLGGIFNALYRWLRESVTLLRRIAVKLGVDTKMPWDKPGKS